MIGIAFALAFFAAACLLGAFGAAAHPGDDAMAEWYRSLHAPDGSSCCDMRDCAPSDARLREGQWEVPTIAGDGWVAVPPERVLRRANMVGQAVLCRLPSGVIMCFVPGLES